MALQTSGVIYLSQVQAEFGGTNPIYMSDYYGADTGIPGSGTIYMSQFYGKSSSDPGSTSYTTPGTYSFNVPKFTTLTVDVRGAGGGGSNAFDSGNNGGTSVFYSSTNLRGNGGIGARKERNNDGADGTASGGESNITGGGANGGGAGSYGSIGGDGGRAVKTWSKTEAGHPSDTQNITVVVGAGGNGGSGTGNDGGDGTNGAVYISWT